MAHTFSRLRALALCMTALLGAACLLTSCEETTEQWDPYENWQGRNIAWFASVADSARTAISQAKAQYGDEWEKHCEWRMYKTLQRSASTRGPLTDSICCRILQRGTGGVSPAFTDSIRLSFRGWLMPAEYEKEDGTLETRMQVFTQTYYGDYNPATAAPQVGAVKSFTEGFGTALQYMVKDDDWLVYIPSDLAYGAESSSSIPAYSTLLFRIHLMGVYESGSGVPEWK